MNIEKFNFLIKESLIKKIEFIAHDSIKKQINQKNIPNTKHFTPKSRQTKNN